MVETFDNLEELLWRILNHGREWPSLRERIESGDCDAI